MISMDSYEVLHSPFDIKTHKKTFINYLEVVISPEGVIEYGVPSHTQKLENILMKQLNITKGQLLGMCPKEYYCDYNNWLCMKTGYIMVWGLPNSYVVGKPNEKQKEVINLLKREELF